MFFLTVYYFNNANQITSRLAQEREYTKLIDNANAPIFGVDTQGRVNVWNQCAIQLVGYSSEEV